MPGGRPIEITDPRRYSSIFSASVFSPFEDLVRKEGRAVNTALSEFMATYVKLHQPNLQNTTMESWFETNTRFIATPQLFDKASIWDKYLSNNCTDKELDEMYDQLDAVMHAVKLQKIARAQKNHRDEYMKHRARVMADNNSGNYAKIDAIYDEAAKEGGLLPKT